MKRYRRVSVLLLVVVLLLSVAGCASANIEKKPEGKQPSSSKPTSPTLPTNSTVSPDTFDYAQFGTTKEEVEAQHEQYGKGNTELEISKFRYGEVSVKVYPFAMDYDYTVLDFQEVGCTKVEVLGTYPNADMPTTWIILSILDQTEQGVLDAMDILIQREDIYVVVPNYVTSQFPTETVRELTEEAKQIISGAWLATNNEQLDWDAKNNMGESCMLYLGSYNGKYAFATIGDCPITAVDFTYEIGPYTLVNNCPFDILVCVDGKLATLSIAYQQDLLTADETMSIVLYLSNFFDFDE